MVVDVGVLVGVLDGVGVFVIVGVEGVLVGVLDGVGVFVIVGVAEGVLVGVLVTVGVGVDVAIEMARNWTYVLSPATTSATIAAGSS